MKHDNRNKKTFKFKVTTIVDDEENEPYLIEKRFKCTKDLTNEFNIPRNTIYYIMNGGSTKKYRDFKIERINETAICFLDS